MVATSDLQVAAADPVPSVTSEASLLLEVDAVTKRFGGLPAVDGVAFGVEGRGQLAGGGPHRGGQRPPLDNKRGGGPPTPHKNPKKMKTTKR